MPQASGRWRLLADADLATSLDQRDAFMSAIIPGETDIVIGSREAARAVRIDQPWYRHAIGRGFNWIVQATVFRGIEDTQCGFKLFRADAAELLFQQQRIDGFAFDVEVPRHPPREVECAQRRIPKWGR
jgi:dolichyl-phosphate beta-glucosyltransferase